MDEHFEAITLQNENSKMSDQEIMEIARRIGHEWTEIGVTLGYAYQSLEMLEDMYRYQPTRRNFVMINYWCKTLSEYDLNVRKLLAKFFEKANRSDIADSMNVDYTDTIIPDLIYNLAQKLTFDRLDERTTGTSVVQQRVQIVNMYCCNMVHHAAELEDSVGCSHATHALPEPLIEKIQKKVTEQQSLASKINGLVDTNYTVIQEDGLQLQEEDDLKSNQQKPSLSPTQSSNMPLMRIYQSVKHNKRTGSKVMKAGWMVHFTQNDPARKRYYWRLDSKCITLFQKEDSPRYHKEILLSHIVNIEPAKIRPNSDPNKTPYVFEMWVNSTVYFVGEDPTFAGREGNIVASQESGVGLEQARYWEHAIRQALMPVTPTSSVEEGKSTSMEDMYNELVGKRYSIVVAIDVGTSYSGYAYCKHSDYKKNKADPIMHCSKWNSGISITMKAPSCVLFNQKQEFVKFGYEAMSYYHDNPDKKDFRDWYYFENFKMILYEEKDKLTKNTDLQEYLGLDNDKGKKKKEKMKAVDVFAAVIKYFKEQLFDTIEKTGISDADRTRWVITVPAIWDLKAKTFMREAAVKAGIPTKQLILALETEAASIHCHRVSVGVISKGDGLRIITGLNIGSKYIVLDRGGDTTGIAVYEVTGENTLKEIHQACGGHWGDTTVNAKFTKFLHDLFGPNVIKKVKEKSSSAYFELLRNFEYAKTAFNEDHANGPEGLTTILMPCEWIEVFEELNKKTLQDMIMQTNFSKQVLVKRQRLRLRNNLFRTFFDYQIENITQELSKLLFKEELSDVKTLLIVGGHSESTVLTTAIEKAFPKLDIVVSKQPDVAILKGAVLFGFEPKFITSRVMQYTYGISMQRSFISGVDAESLKMCLVNGLVDNVFDKHLERGQTVKVGKFQPEHEYVPVHKDQMVVHYKFYATLNKNPKYVTDDGCTCIGALYFKLSEGMSSNKEMMLKINASGTEIEAIVTEKATGKQIEGYFCLLD